MSPLFWIIVLILVFGWGGGLFLFHAGSLINLLLVVLVIYVLYTVLVGRGGPPVL